MIRSISWKLWRSWIYCCWCCLSVRKCADFHSCDLCSLQIKCTGNVLFKYVCRCVPIVRWNAILPRALQMNRPSSEFCIQMWTNHLHANEWVNKNRLAVNNGEGNNDTIVCVYVSVYVSFSGEPSMPSAYKIIKRAREKEEKTFGWTVNCCFFHRAISTDFPPYSNGFCCFFIISIAINTRTDAINEYFDANVYTNSMWRFANNSY